MEACAGLPPPADIHRVLGALLAGGDGARWAPQLAALQAPCTLRTTHLLAAYTHLAKVPRPLCLLSSAPLCLPVPQAANTTHLAPGTAAPFTAASASSASAVSWRPTPGALPCSRTTVAILA